MKWTSAIVAPENAKAPLSKALRFLCSDVKEKLKGRQIDLAICFVSPHFYESYEKFPEEIFSHLNPGTFIGCSAGGVISGGQEVEQKPAIALCAASLPDVNLKPFHLSGEHLPDLDDPPSAWEKLVGFKTSEIPSFILLPDPFSFPIDTLVQGLDYAFPKSTKIGGLASAAGKPGANALFLNKETYKSGCVGVALTGNIIVESIVAQGCRPIGKPYRITSCEQNLLFELDGKPAIVILHDLLEALPRQDQELARNSLFIGLVMDEFKDSFKPGDFLIRNILGLEPTSGALVVGEALRNERTVQFHLRDAATSADDLRFMLKQYCDRHAALPGKDGASGALLFSCLGRGEYLYGRPNHDSDCFREYLGEIPLGGFFCNGEIGPVGGTTFLHGYTSSFGIFRSKESAGKDKGG